MTDFIARIAVMVCSRAREGVGSSGGHGVTAAATVKVALKYALRLTS